ncbi:unnamed protein product [Nyctereutes procyonoides]|uniref:(raccoon dog) hypothetical protein n=1 Tax=Nyctereutes procyonoides TaxID=34880 RepID=A0A811YGA1_NYCPR|nr:uncharacterized protein C4orf19 homolog [Nyctereutes procyonoides]XP_055182224.1 uncharacterized protein C4orf19 homolog [Nyctereutes procyonoides]XP_055182225.1 uncharacterized protein C4orf19 homolog [Nyctereutes procyonoides]XP_055182227.1 uncharacterized protein C4orf19 homolog [Nyctereutes procyonoides]XP_055182228.1 uncharacterized protein C4orf19 homolog [Nyctereutes procyonoides]XP_055182229.1 uncharacterized protein C4orf19 homolog [Nyctereutes procyonoides]CAD7675858.1 unnamed pr
MGCRCCKMIQSYLFDPVQVASPGYVNEVNSCKVDEGRSGQAQGKQSGEALVHKEELRREAPRGAGSALNGVGPASAPQRGPRKQGGDADPRPGEGPAAEGPAAEEPAPAPRLPPPDYPAPQGCAVRPGGAGRGHPPAGGRGLRTPEPPRTSWDASNEPVATDVLRLYLQDAGAAAGAAAGADAGAAAGADAGAAAGAAPGAAAGAAAGAAPGAAAAAGSRGGWEDAPEDAAVAEALAALEAATAGEDVDEAD